MPRKNETTAIPPADPIELADWAARAVGAMAPTATHPERLLAIHLLLQAIGIRLLPVAVRGVVYGRSAVLRLGGPLMPYNDGEWHHFAEQVGPAMAAIGVDAPHAVLVGDDGLLVEPGNLRVDGIAGMVEPLAHRVVGPEPWIADGLRYGLCIIYDRQTCHSPPTPDAACLHRAASLARWVLDARDWRNAADVS